jgi:hypothetical protein
MLQRFGVLEATGSAEVDQEQFALFFGGSEHEISGHNLVVEEVLEVKVLKNGYDFLGEHEGGLEGEKAAAECEQCLD